MVHGGRPGRAEAGGPARNAAALGRATPPRRSGSTRPRAADRASRVRPTAARRRHAARPRARVLRRGARPAAASRDRGDVLGRALPDAAVPRAGRPSLSGSRAGMGWASACSSGAMASSRAVRSRPTGGRSGRPPRLPYACTSGSPSCSCSMPSMASCGCGTAPTARRPCRRLSPSTPALAARPRPISSWGRHRIRREAASSGIT